ncbi:MAG: hypothetical protein KKF44_00290 [Nanoarchaeota archaeon]|nr:hypothetical protein [Nanoarchaeota archaeon]
MAWQKLVDTDELIIFEKAFKKFRIKIEARKNHDKAWDVFQTKIEGNSSLLLSKKTLSSRTEADQLIKKLLTTGLPRKRLSTDFAINLKRVFKEEYVEKWKIELGNSPYTNYMYLLYMDRVGVDIMMHESFRLHEERILQNIEDTLGLREINDAIDFNVFYYTSRREINREAYESDANMVFGKFEFHFEDE